jgi:enoyl-[acyl-carrier-protein] reductase (NADH)
VPEGAVVAAAEEQTGGPEAGTDGPRSQEDLDETVRLDPEVIANAALWLHSDLAAKVTGVARPVDGGHMLLTGVNMAPAQ